MTDLKVHFFLFLLQVVLRLRRFRLPTPHPTSALLHIAAVLRVPCAVAAASLCLLHDVATFSPVLLPLPPPVGVASKQDSEQNAGGPEWEGWGPHVEADEACGRVLLKAAVHGAQLHGLNGAEGTQHSHVAAMSAAVHDNTAGAASDGVSIGSGSRGASLCARGVLVLPEGSEHVRMELHETLVAAACLHAAMLIVQPSQQQQQQASKGQDDQIFKQSGPPSLRMPDCGGDPHVQPDPQEKQLSCAPLQPIVLYPPVHFQQHHAANEGFDSHHSTANVTDGALDGQSTQVAGSRGLREGREDGLAASPAYFCTQGLDSEQLPLPTWASAFGVSPQAVEAVAAVATGAISRACEELGKGAPEPLPWHTAQTSVRTASTL